MSLKDFFLLNKNSTSEEILDLIEFKATIIRSKRRKTLAINVKNGVASIHVPNKLPKNDAEKMILARKEWILKHISRQKAALKQTARQFVDGEQFYFRGIPYSLSIGTTGSDRLDRENGRILISNCPDNSCPDQDRNRIRALFFDLGKDHLEQRTVFYAEKIGVSPAKLKIRDYKSRWGSCSNRGQISFNWRITLAPDRIIDYVVVHELCHLIEHNHSARFWTLVEKHNPAYKEARKWLKTNGLLLKI